VLTVIFLSLLNDILTITNEYAKVGVIARFQHASQTRRTLLNLHGRLRLFLDTYMVGRHVVIPVKICVDAHQAQTTNPATRVNLDALAGPVPVFDSVQTKLIPDEVQWDIMSHSGHAPTTAVGSQSQVSAWRRTVRNGCHQDDVESNGVVDTGAITICAFCRNAVLKFA